MTPFINPTTKTHTPTHEHTNTQPHTQHTQPHTTHTRTDTTTHNHPPTQHTTHTHHKHDFKNNPKEQYAFNFQMVHPIMQLTMLVILHCHLHRCLSQDDIHVKTNNKNWKIPRWWKWVTQAWSGMCPTIVRKNNMRSTFSGSLNYATHYAQCVLHFAATFIVVRTKTN